jgi:hypothetical protein
LPIAIILPTFSLTATQYQSYFAFMITFAVMTPLGTFVSDYSPVLNQYTTQITAYGILFYFVYHHL